MNESQPFNSINGSGSFSGDLLSEFQFKHAPLLCGVAIATSIAFALNSISSKNSKRSKSNRSSGENNHRDRIKTRIHGKWYDLTNFEHPGGPVALSLTKGRDATALFESHHYFTSRNMLMKILSKYELPLKEAAELKTHDQRDDGSPYIWKNIDHDGFSSELRTLVNEYFSKLAKEKGISKTQATKATFGRWLTVLTLIGLFFASIPWLVQGQWAFLIITPVLGWLAICNYWHDSLHFSLSSNWRVNAYLPYLMPLISSPSMWYHQHVIGHHVYTNISNKDPDLAHAPQLMREHESIRWKKSHLNQKCLSRVLLVWSIAVGLGLQILNDVRALKKLSYNNVVAYDKPSKMQMAAHIAGRIIYILFAFAWPFALFPAWKAMIWATVPNVVFSLCFMINTQINHLVGHCAHAFDSNFFKHQIITAQNFGRDSAFCFYFSGGLNYQIEHHLFPTVNHCHLPALSPGVKKICKKYGVPYNSVSGYRQAIEEHFAHTAAMSVKPE
mmetsp:Transcript_14355/g.30141  ORF Transcript_14355/g.30141 Transcript_14355/m.30141 type:complete len:500 (+) Transcript_14355:68-1567(+)|eukprot:CAMPEP_0171343550 /NCGR_PEP_ID=MMETSP0878-20121228/17420_1 /TAXON_ID=67004 /ORGANISM="Thalassiosira weissflogii, Strain CCMP1336" /LENGTH=499 /DNA_ID=CAMNT_0011846515 /DNA_START=15 /DNA_END=1514 /DNA_ORIENTATION=-